MTALTNVQSEYNGFNFCMYCLFLFCCKRLYWWSKGLHKPRFWPLFGCLTSYRPEIPFLVCGDLINTGIVYFPTFYHMGLGDKANGSIYCSQHDITIKFGDAFNSLSCFDNIFFHFCFHFLWYCVFINLILLFLFCIAFLLNFPLCLNDLFDKL